MIESIIFIIFLISPLVVIVLVFLYLTSHSRQKKRLRQVEGGYEDIVVRIHHDQKQQWFSEMSRLKCDSELEVEVKFIGPLLSNLGYSSEDYNIRVSVDLRLGSQTLTGEADWLVYKKGTRNGFFVIEAKSQSVSITGEVIGQARSYADGLSVPYYVITNGIKICVFQRALPNDKLLFKSSVDDLSSNWPTLFSLIGVRSANTNSQVT